MPIDPRISVAVSMQSRKGVYALLLGSGASRAAEIPTGWEVVLDLIKRVVALSGEDEPDDPIAWFAEQAGEPATYSAILAALGKTQADRSQILRGYFEPTKEDREEGRKVPTRCHRAISNLVQAGHIKVIVTTNFDRLMEHALADAGVQPTVLSMEASFEGATPLQHTDCTILKIHGDYLDLRTRNTTDELEEYPAPLAALLRRVLTEYGLLVCGWSGEWDRALERMILGTSRHRYSTYWLARGELGEAASRIVAHRNADVVPIESADEFFEDLEGKVSALEEGRASDPVSSQVVFNTTKRYLSEQRFDIRLDSMLLRETDHCMAVMHGPEFDLSTPTPDNDLVRQRCERAMVVSEMLRAILMAGCHWGEDRHERLWRQCLQRLMKPPSPRTHYDLWKAVWHLPCALSFYSAGIASVAAERYATLQTLLTDCSIRTGNGRKLLLEIGLAGNYSDAAKIVNNLEYYPGNQLFHKWLRSAMAPLVGSSTQFTEVFDRFECLAGMTYFDLNQHEATCFRDWNRDFVPDGRYFLCEHDPVFPPTAFADEVNRAGQEWPPLREGMFGGSLERVQAALAAVRTQRGQRFP